MRLTIQPEDLVPQLPKPKDLQPFPTGCALTYKGHKNMIRTVTIEPTGQFMASGSDDGTVRIWEIQTGYCMKTFDFKGSVIRSVMWCPNKALSLLAVAVDNKVVLINASVGDKVVVGQTAELLRDAPDNEGYSPPERVRTAVTWALPEPEDKLPQEALIVLKCFKPVKQVTWHGKGDYFATVLTDGANRSVLIHQLSRWRSQIPFSKSKGLIQTVLFHPIRPYLFVATQRHVRVYNLSKQELSKKLQTGAKWISSLAIHPKGDNVLVGTYDKRVQWFDLDLSTLPYQVLRYHHSAVRQVSYHKRYPLFASCADDTSIIVSHGMVYNDLLQNPLIVPVKHLRGHTKYDDFGVMEVIWHPTQPWLVSAGADGFLKLWT
jgi:ribosome biogenesis protein ERB1